MTNQPIQTTETAFIVNEDLIILQKRLDAKVARFEHLYMMWSRAKKSNAPYHVLNTLVAHLEDTSRCMEALELQIWELEY